MAWHDKYVVFDTETTGFGEDARIVEIALVEYAHGLTVPTGIFSSLVNPGEVDWSDPGVAKAMEINGLKPEWLVDAPSWGHISYQVKEALRKNPVWVAHNLQFDERMIQQEFARDIHMADLLVVPRPEVRACTLLCDFRINPGKKSRKLIEVANRWKIDLKGGHRAVNDTMACARIFQKMKVFLPETEEKFCNSQSEWSVKWKRITGY